MTCLQTSDVVEVAVKKLTESYELDKDFINSVNTSLESTLKKYYIYDTPQQVGADAAADAPKGKKKAVTTPAKDKAPRKKSGYNYFVAAKMPEFSAVPHQERMAKIGELWKAVTPEEKAKYVAMAAAAPAEAK